MKAESSKLKGEVEVLDFVLSEPEASTNLRTGEIRAES